MYISFWFLKSFVQILYRTISRSSKTKCDIVKFAQNISLIRLSLYKPTDSSYCMASA